MDNNTFGLLGLITGLLGAAISGAVTKKIEGSQKKADFEREIRRLFFVNKLKAGEEIYGHLSLLLHQIKQLRLLFTRLKDDDDTGTPGISESILKNIKDTEAKINTGFSNTVHAYGYFFNDEDENDFKFDGSVGDLYRSFESIIVAHKSCLLSNTQEEYLQSRDVFCKMVDAMNAQLEDLINRIKLKLKGLRDYNNNLDIFPQLRFPA